LPKDTSQEVAQRHLGEAVRSNVIREDQLNRAISRKAFKLFQRLSFNMKSLYVAFGVKDLRFAGSKGANEERTFQHVTSL